MFDNHEFVPQRGSSRRSAKSGKVPPSVMKKKPTIHDIAEMAGVCIGTVSRVINNKDRVHPETRRRIAALIAKTGYRPSAMARGLVLNRSHNILLGVHDIADPYCSTIAKLASRKSRKHGYSVVLGDWNNDHAVEADYLQRVPDGRVDGLIVSPLPGEKNGRWYTELVRANFPVVALDNLAPTVDLNSVTYDDAAIGRMAVGYLVQKGHRRIAFLLTGPQFRTVQGRYKGYVEGHEAAGIPVDRGYLLTAPRSLATWKTLTLAPLFRLPKPPTAIVTENEMTASSCINLLLRMGKRIPADIAVMAIGDVLAESAVPLPLTVIPLRHEEAIHRAVDSLLELIEDPELRRKPPRHYVQKPKLIVRESA